MDYMITNDSHNGIKLFIIYLFSCSIICNNMSLLYSCLLVFVHVMQGFLNFFVSQTDPKYLLETPEI